MRAISSFQQQQVNYQFPQQPVAFHQPQAFPQQVSFAAPSGYNGIDPFGSQMATVHQNMFQGWSNFTGGGAMNSHPLLSGGGYSPPPSFGGGGGMGVGSALPYPGGNYGGDPFYAEVNAIYNQVGQISMGGGGGQVGGGYGGGGGGRFQDPFANQVEAIYNQVGALAGGGNGGQIPPGYNDPFTPQIEALQAQWAELMTAPPEPVPQPSPEQAAQAFAPMAAIFGEVLKTVLGELGLGNGGSGNSGNSGSN